MSNILLARIDDRLIHGQVMTSWVRFVKSKNILIIDDETYHDTFIPFLYHYGGTKRYSDTGAGYKSRNCISTRL